MYILLLISFLNQIYFLNFLILFFHNVLKLLHWQLLSLFCLPSYFFVLLMPLSVSLYKKKNAVHVYIKKINHSVYAHTLTWVVVSGSPSFHFFPLHSLKSTTTCIVSWRCCHFSFIHHKIKCRLSELLCRQQVTSVSLCKCFSYQQI